MSAARYLAALVWRTAPWHVLACLVVALAEAALPIALVWLTKLALDRLVTPGPLELLLGLAAGLVVAGLVGAVTPQLGQYVRAELDRRVGRRAKDELFAAVERFGGLSRFENPEFLDRLRLAQQSAEMPGRLLDAAFQLGRGAVTLAGLLGSLAVIAPWFAAVVVVASVPAFLLEVRLSRRRADMLWQIGPAERREHFYAFLLASAEAAKEIRLLGLGPFLRGRMNAELRASDQARRLVDRRELSVQGLLAVLAALVAGGGLLWVVAAAGRGALTVGDVSMFIAAVAGVQAAINGLVNATATAHQQLAMSVHYLDVVSLSSDLSAPREPRALPALRRGIELRDVWFRYSDGHPWVLRGVDVFLPHGRAVGLVGHNGSGKSTLVKLLCRFYDPQRGEILWDGVNIRDVPAEELRARLAVVFQDFMSYDFTAHDNIAVGDLTASRERIEEAAEQAGVHDTLAALPLGYETLLTRVFFTASDEGDPQVGVLLSGGQWQRIALARAFLRQERDFMILDEPSAGLDPEAEHDLHARLREVRAGRTSLLISHRLSAVREADVIVVLAGGVVAEEGDHAGLLAAGGTYARLFTIQAAGYVDPEGVLS